MEDFFTFCKANESDIPSIVTLVNKAYRGESSRKGWTTEADFLEGIRVDETSVAEMITHPGAIIILCKNGENTLKGCVYLEKQSGKRLYLGMLTVEPENQSKGIGKKLLERSESYAREQMCSYIVMTVITIRYELIAWYERHGFRKTNEVRPFPDNPKFGIPRRPLEFVLMEKLLPS